MIGLTLIALLHGKAEWNSAWLNGIQLEPGIAANFQIAWQDQGRGRQYRFTVHRVGNSTPKHSHTLSYEVARKPDYAPRLEMAYLGQRKEPILVLHLNEYPFSPPKFVAFSKGNPIEDLKLTGVLGPFLRPESPSLVISQGSFKLKSSAPKAGFTYQKTGVSPNNYFVRSVDVSENRDLKFGPWVEEPYSGPDAITLQGGAGRDSFKVVLRKSNFRLRGHKVGFTKYEELTIDEYKVKGVERGKDGITGEEMVATLLKNRLTSISVSFASRNIQIPRLLVVDCFNVHFGEGYAKAWLSENQKDLFIQISGSDAGSGYSATFRIRRDGKVTRHIERP